MPNFLTSSAFVETATKCLATACLVSQRRQAPIAGGVGVGHRLQGRERLRRDDEQRLGGVEVAGRLGEVGAVDVGHEPERQAPVAVVLQRLVGHHRAEVRAADADVHHVADPFPAVTRPRPVANPVGERGHPVEHRVDRRNDVLAVHDDRLPLRRPQRHMQDRAALGDVDLIAPEHRVDPIPKAGLLGQLNQQPHRLISDAVLRVVQIQPDRLGRQPFAPPGVVREQRPQVQVSQLLVMRFKGCPCGALYKRRHGGRHLCKNLLITGVFAARRYAGGVLKVIRMNLPVFRPVRHLNGFSSANLRPRKQKRLSGGLWRLMG